MSESLLPMAKVLAQVGLSRSRIYAMVRKGEFPMPRLVQGRSLWVESEVQAWIAEQVNSAPVVGTLAGRAEAATKKAA